MSHVAVHIDKLGKKYRIGTRETQATSRAQAIQRLLAAPFSYLLTNLREPNKDELVWALRDVSFDVKQGEVVGLIGRNGAGKSTLLKILSRITDPSEGSADLYGRVGSLLEVGTGFHPDLTGRENVYMNGTLLGMSKAEIDRKFDEILDFAGVEKFIDTRVKYYSSGMHVRLGFAVAAHLDPEILLVDEVLAVGDIEFQKKCLGKMKDITHEGRTIIFISHQMNAVRNLCDRCIWLDGGTTRMEGPTVNVVSAYEAALMAIGSDESRNQNARFVDWDVVGANSSDPHMVDTLEPITIRMRVQVNKILEHGLHGIALWNLNNQLMWGWSTDRMRIEPGDHEFIYHLPSLPLKPGVYQWHVTLWDDNELIVEQHPAPELIIGTKPQTHPNDDWSGILNIPCDFTLNSPN